VLHAGVIEKDFSDAGAPTPWVTDAVLARVLREGVVPRPDPQHVLYHIGEPLHVSSYDCFLLVGRGSLTIYSYVEALLEMLRR
jgi:hypothetical protein